MRKTLLHFFIISMLSAVNVQQIKAQEQKVLPAISEKPADKAQEVAKKKSSPKKNSFFNNIFKKVKSSVTVSKQDSINKSVILNTKSVIPYIEHQDKIIRSISIKQLGFDKIFTDTLKRFNNIGNRVLNTLHVDTYDWVIRDNLFIKTGNRVNP